MILKFHRARHSDMLAIILEDGTSNPDSETAINSNTKYCLVELLDGGNHHKNYNCYQNQQYRANNERILPRETMLVMVIEKDL
jgi:hypothetical protein